MNAEGQDKEEFACLQKGWMDQPLKGEMQEDELQRKTGGGVLWATLSWPYLSYRCSTGSYSHGWEVGKRLNTGYKRLRRCQ